MATIYDVAKRAGVSTYTVSAVLNRSAFVSPELTKRVLEAVQELDYTINDLARSLQTRKTRTIGMLVPDIGNPFNAKVVRGVEDKLRNAGYTLLIGNTYNDTTEQTRYLAIFRSKQVDGLLIYLAAGEEDDVRRVVEAKKPIVMVARAPHTFEADTVTGDNVEGARMAVEHLIARGHQRIGILVGQLSLTTSADRVEGWRLTLQAHGLPAPDEWIGEGDWTETSGCDYVRRVFAGPNPPTAVFAANFLMMVGVLRGLKDLRLAVPQQVEVMSSDDSEWLDVFQPRISTVAQPSYTMGEAAADMLLHRLKHPDEPPRRVLLKPDLCIRH
ncbi:MAG: LacI family DNA-binding transcriptional regulator [Bryobacteraceae bacterium]